MVGGRIGEWWLGGGVSILRHVLCYKFDSPKITLKLKSTIQLITGGRIM